MKEGWEKHLTHYYPESGQKYYHLIYFTNGTQHLVFIPVDEVTEAHHLKVMSLKTIQHYLEYTLSTSIKGLELFFFTNESCEEELLETLNSLEHQAGVLTLCPGKIEFSRGEFKNSRLEYRFSKLKPNPDYVPGILPLGIQQLGDDMSRVSFYHSILHLISQSWLEGEQNIALIDVLHRYNPFYDCFNKQDKKEFLDVIGKDLKEAFKKFYSGIMTVENYRKNSNSHPVIMIDFLKEASSKKEISNWFKKQKQALDWLQSSHQQMLLNVLSLIEE